MWRKITDLNGLEIVVNLDNVITIARASGGSKIRFVNGEEITVKEAPEVLLMSRTIRAA